MVKAHLAILPCPSQITKLNLFSWASCKFCARNQSLKPFSDRVLKKRLDLPSSTIFIGGNIGKFFYQSLNEYVNAENRIWATPLE
jgi:hypothetical protein